MPDFHDPSTREQMEREGWTFDNGEYVKDEKGLHVHVCDHYLNIAVASSRSQILLCMKSFDAALKAANAILEGVEG